MTKPSDVEASLTAFIQDELLGGDDGEVAPEDDLLGNGLVDSIGVMRIVQHVDARFGVRVQPADITLENFQTIARIAAYVRSNATNGARTELNLP
jgi:acyl carrier protein